MNKFTFFSRSSFGGLLVFALYGLWFLRLGLCILGVCLGVFLFGFVFVSIVCRVGVVFVFKVGVFGFFKDF